MKKKFLKTMIFLCVNTFTYGQMPLSAGEHFADINGIKIHYYVGGQGPVCLFPSPGWGPSIDGYMKSLKPFEKYFTMVWYDTRCSGKSTGPADSTQFTSQDFLNEMDSLRTYLKQKKVWIAGHSSGGFQVLNYGIQHSDKLNGIIALSAIAGRDSFYFQESQKVAERRKGKPYFEKGYAVYLGTDTTHYSSSETMKLIFPFYFHNEKNIPKFLALSGGELSEKVEKSTAISKFGSENLFPDLKKIIVPTLVLVGDDDFICDKISQSDRIAKNIPHASEIVIKDAGHFSWIEQPAQFFASLQKWIDNQRQMAQK